jgi:hypothetical protein
MDLPTGPLTAGNEQALKIIGGMLGALIGAHMAGLQALPNRQQIHPSPALLSNSG